jgi:OmcA/MtrC family decaheme c-type cytochrome
MTSFVLSTTTTTLVGGIDYGANGAATNLVTSTITEKCVACHDSTLAKAHMTSNGGVINGVRSTAYNSLEQCLLCHGTGKVADIKAVHAE